jgi:hypothetical protein
VALIRKSRIRFSFSLVLYRGLFITFGIATNRLAPIVNLNFVYRVQEKRQQQQVISSSGSCGIISGVRTTCLGSVQGNCCSRVGFCGSDSSYCGAGCQPGFGVCGNSKISTDGSCAGTNGLTCLGAVMGNCCSRLGFCGSDSSYCGAGCQSQFGDCLSVSTTSSSSSRSSSSTLPASQSGDNQKNTSGLSTGAMVGLGVGIPLVVLLLGGAAGWMFWRRRKLQKQNAVTPPPYDEKKEPADTKSIEMESSNSPSELGVQYPPQELPAQVYR